MTSKQKFRSRGGSGSWDRPFVACDAVAPPPFTLTLPPPVVVDLRGRGGDRPVVHIGAGTARLRPGDGPIGVPPGFRGRVRQARKLVDAARRTRQDGRTALDLDAAVQLSPTYPVWQYTVEGRPADGGAVVLVTQRNEQAEVEWANDLGGAGWPFADGRGPRDRMAMAMSGMTPYRPGYTVVHLHGAHVDWWHDGYPRRMPPDSPPVRLPEVATPEGADALRRTVLAPGENAITVLRNDQPGGANLWFHDHVFGSTGPNVYAGLAGALWVRHEQEAEVLPTLDEGGSGAELPLILSDRSFGIDVGDPANPAITPVYGTPDQMEFYGAVPAVNGVLQPKVDVEPRVYRLRIVNGANSRFHNLWFSPVPHDSTTNYVPGTPDAPAYLIGTDGGFLAEPVTIGDATRTDLRLTQSDELLLGTGERADVLVDFTHLAGKGVVLWSNTLLEPYQGTLPRRRHHAQPIMRFDVAETPVHDDRPITPELFEQVRQMSTTVVAEEQPDLDLPQAAEELRSWQSRLISARGRRQVQPPASLPVPLTRRVITLIEPDPGYPSFALPEDGMVRTRSWGGVTEHVDQGSVELWNIVNLTGDTHPIHLHLVQFRIVGRLTFGDPPVDFSQQYNFVPPRGSSYEEPDAIENGWKDVVRVNPGTCTQVLAYFDLPGHYVYHCHILEHEDAGMMRAFTVLPAPGSPADGRSLVAAAASERNS